MLALYVIDVLQTAAAQYRSTVQSSFDGCLTKAAAAAVAANGVAMKNG